MFSWIWVWKKREYTPVKDLLAARFPQMWNEMCHGGRGEQQRLHRKFLIVPSTDVCEGGEAVASKGPFNPKYSVILCGIFLLFLCLLVLS